MFPFPQALFRGGPAHRRRTFACNYAEYDNIIGAINLVALKRGTEDRQVTASIGSCATAGRRRPGALPIPPPA